MKKYLYLTLAAVLLLPSALRAEELPDAPIYVAAGEVRDAKIKTKGPVTVDGTVNADIEIFGASLTVRGKVNGDVAALGGKVELGGEIGGDVASMGGGVSMSGSITGDLVVIGGDLVMASSSSVKGDVTVIGGEIDRAANAEIKGTLTNLESTLGGVIPLVSSKIQEHLEKLEIDVAAKGDKWSARREARKERRKERREERRNQTPLQRLVGLVFFLIAVAGFGVIMMLLTMLVPKQVETVRAAMKDDFWRAAGSGFLVIAAFMPVLIFLTVSIVGIPMVPLAFVALFIAMLMGVSGFSLVLAERLFGVMKRSMPELMLSVGAGFVVLNGLLIVGKAFITIGGLFTPIGVIFIFANLMLLSVAVLLGLGAVLMTRMGTRKHVRRLTPAAAKPAAEESIEAEAEEVAAADETDAESDGK